MPITIYPGTVKKRNANGTYSDLIPGADVPVSEIEELQDIVGNGQLSGFTATDLTGAANELKNTLNSEIATRQTYVRPNLLDNWYFVGGGSQQSGGRFPINQRGLSIYSNGNYTVDRWKTYEGTTITTESDGLLIESNQSSSWKLVQQYERGFLEGIKGKEVTFSVLFKGQTTRYIAANIYTNEGNHTGNSETSESGIAKVTYTIPNNITDFRCVIYGDAAFHAKIVAMKLELGSGQTLAHQENGQWVLNEIPNYGEELAKCQRYYWNPMIGAEYPEHQWWFPAVTDTGDNMLAINITYPVTMARAPDIVLLSNTLRNQNNGENITITSMAYNRTNSVFSNVFSMVLSKNLTAGKYYGFQFALSADL